MKLYIHKIISLIILFLLVTSKITAMSRDTIYYECLDELSFDTIPYMVKDQAFLDGLNELQMMFDGKKPYSLKRAEFIVEWAYSGYYYMPFLRNHRRSQQKEFGNTYQFYLWRSTR